MDWRSDGSWEALGIDPELESEANQPLPRPVFSDGPRIAPKHQLNRSVANPKQPPAIRRLPLSGDALERPLQQPSRSSGSFRNVAELQPSALVKPEFTHTSIQSLMLPRDLPELQKSSSKIVNQIPAVAKPSNVAKSQPAAPLKRPRTAPAGKPQDITRIRHSSESIAVKSLIPAFLQLYVWYSDLLTRLQNSDNGQSHLLRILDGFSPNTMLRYLNCLLSFGELCKNLRISLADLDDIKMADLLMTGASEVGRFSSMTLKAIRWAFKTFGLTCFEHCFSPIVSSFCKTKFVTERKESLPLPLLILVQWERRVLQSAATPAEILILGTFLVMAFSGMRFGDIQRVMVHRMQFDGKTLRGVSWKTKTCNSGVPFGVVCTGFLSKGSHHWVYKFLTCLDSMLALADSGQIDFLLPDVSDPASPLMLSAMPYSTALYFFRHFMSLPWRKTPLVFGNITHYTIHGLKSTFLSWASQLKLDPESRRLQGHHKDPLKSTRLYSRDDIDGSIFVQETIIQKIQEGWRPHTPLSRGGQLPLQEPQVILESFKKEAVDYQWLFFSFGDPNHVLILPEPDVSLQSESSSSSSSSDSSASDRTDEPTKKKSIKVPLVDFSSVEELEMASYRQTLHVIMHWDEDSNLSGFRSTRTACGKSFPSETVKPHAEIPQDSNIKFCTHPGCRKGWMALGALA